MVVVTQDSKKTVARLKPGKHTRHFWIVSIIRLHKIAGKDDKVRIMFIGRSNAPSDVIDIERHTVMDIGNLAYPEAVELFWQSGYLYRRLFELHAQRLYKYSDKGNEARYDEPAFQKISSG